MKSIRITTGCRASGRGYAEGEIISMPDGISADDAALLVRIGRAEQIEIAAVTVEAAPVSQEQPAEKKSGRARK